MFGAGSARVGLIEGTVEGITVGTHEEGTIRAGLNDGGELGWVDNSKLGKTEGTAENKKLGATDG